MYGVRAMWTKVGKMLRDIYEVIYIARLFIPPTVGTTPHYRKRIKLVLFRLGERSILV